jgi:hypothetical protein
LVAQIVNWWPSRPNTEIEAPLTKNASTNTAHSRAGPPVSSEAKIGMGSVTMAAFNERLLLRRTRAKSEESERKMRLG